MLCYPQFVVTVSRTLVFFSKQFHTYVQRMLFGLQSCFEITHLMLCSPQGVVTVSRTLVQRTSVNLKS